MPLSPLAAPSRIQCLQRSALISSWRLILLVFGGLTIVTTAHATIPEPLATALESPACKAIQPFYWEIGDKDRSLYNGTRGADAPRAHTVMPIASASKWIFAAYVVQKRKGQLLPADVKSLTMQAGYTSLKPGRCVRWREAKRNTQTVAECFNTRNNETHTPQHEGKFFYNGGHFQSLGINALGLSDYNNATLASEITSTLGIPITLSFGSPLLSGGMTTSAVDYAQFLRAMLDGRLLLGAQLGAHAVCTQPAACPTAMYTPVPATMQWQYGLGHWIESDPRTGDGAFSSAGAFGFYPWIDANKRYYGVIARDDKSKGGGASSAECGRQLRQAFSGALR